MSKKFPVTMDTGQEYMIKPFLQKDKKTEFLIYPIVKENGEKYQYVRNPNCKQWNCFFDRSEIMHKYETETKKENFAYRCPNCTTNIKIKDFKADLTTQKAADTIWDKFNAQNSIRVKEMKIMKNFDFEEILLPEPVGGGAEVKSFKRDVTDIPIADRELMDELDNFNRNEYQSLLRDYKKIVDVPPNEVLMEFCFIKITKHSFDTFVEHENMSDEVMAFFLKYVENQDLVKKKIEDTNKIFICAIDAREWDKEKKTLKLKYLSGLDINLKDSNDLKAKYEQLVIVFKHESRWIVTLAALKESTEVDVIDMLDEELNSDQRNNLLDIIKKVVTVKLQGLVFSNFNFIDKFSIDWYSDCGTFVCVYIYQFWKRGTLVNFKANFPIQKDNFKDAFTWLLLKNIKKNHPEWFVTLSDKDLLNQSNHSASLSLGRSIQEENTIELNTARPKQLPLIQRNSTENRPTFDQEEEEEKQMTSFERIMYELEEKHNLKSTNQPQPDPNKIKISKAEFVDLLKNIQDDVMKEVEAKKYPDEDVISKFVDNIASTKGKQMTFSKQQLKALMDDFGRQIKSKVESEEDRAMREFMEYYKKSQEEYQNYLNFQNLLQYYYQYNPDYYMKLVDEYNHRFHNQILEKMGLSEKYSTKPQLMQNLPELFKEFSSRDQISSLNSPPILTSKPSFNVGYTPKAQLKKTTFSERAPSIIGGTEPKTPMKRSTTLGVGSESTRNSMGSNIHRNTTMASTHPERGSNFENQITPRENPRLEKRNTAYPDKRSFPENMPDKLSIVRTPSMKPNLDKRESQYQEIKTPYYRPEDKKRALSINQNNIMKNMMINSQLSESFDIYKGLLDIDAGPKYAIVAKRYNIEITKHEYHALKNESLLSENIINFFVNYLQERQESAPQQRIQKLSLNTLYFSTKFYTVLCSGNPSSTKTDLLSVAGFTSEYEGKGNTIFDKFNIFIIPVALPYHQFLFVSVKLLDKRFTIYDPTLFFASEKVAFNNPVLINISRFVQKEYGDKLGKYLDISSWEYVSGNAGKVDDFKLSGIVCLYSIYMLSLGHTNVAPTSTKFGSFKESLQKLILQIGVTYNMPLELELYNNFVL